MKEKKKNTSPPFSGFEPEVGNDTIDTNWEKIKYFLPAEKKRRGFIYFRKPALIAGLLALISILGIGTFSYLQEEKDNLSYTQKAKHTEPGTRTTAEPLSTKRSEEEAKTLPENNALNTTKENVASTQHSLPEKELPTRDPQLHTARVKSTPAGQEGIPASSAEPLSFSSVNMPVTETYEPIPGNLSEEKYSEGSETYFKLDPVPLGSTPERPDSVNASLTMIPKGLFLKQAPTRRFGLEVFGGPNQMSTHMAYEEPGIQKKKQQINYSGGLGVAYALSHTWQVNASFRMSQHTFSDSYNGATANKVVAKIPALTINTAALDTVIMYVPVYSDNTIRSKTAYYVNLGVGYTFFQKKRIILDAFLQASFSRTAFSFTRGNYAYGDTLQYTQSPTSKPLGNTVQSPEEPQTISYAVNRFGLIPGLSLGYKLTARMALFIKPSYFTEVSKNKISPQQSYFTVKQDNLFVDLGIRIKL